MGHILIVDDDPDIRDVIAMILGRDGHRVTTASDGREALRALESFHPCLILLDLMMPVMDGWAFRGLQLATSELASIPVMVLSGVDDLQASAAELRPCAFLRKPFAAGSLREAVRRHCTPGERESDSTAEQATEREEASACPAAHAGTPAGARVGLCAMRAEQARCSSRRRPPAARQSRRRRGAPGTP